MTPATAIAVSSPAGNGQLNPPTKFGDADEVTIALT